MDAVCVRKDPNAGASCATWGSLRVAILDRDSSFTHALSMRMDRLCVDYSLVSGPVAVDALTSMRLSALIVDLGMLGPQAWPWLEQLCSAMPELCVLVCTEVSTVAERVRGLRLGADDWIVKPCHPEEVIARVEGVVRRYRGATGGTVSKVLRTGELEIRSADRQVCVGALGLGLTRREFELLELLAAMEGYVLERDEIYSRLWGYSMVRGDRSVDVCVRKLRQKLKKVSPRWHYIHTHFGVGYRFSPERIDGAPGRRHLERGVQLRDENPEFVQGRQLL